GSHGAPRVAAGRGAALRRLEDLGARRSAGRGAVRGGNESAGDAARGCQPVDGLARRARPAHEARLRRSAGGGPGADSAPAARRYGTDHVRRGRAPGDPCPGQDGPVDPPGARAARYAGRPWDSRGGGAAASHGLAGAAIPALLHLLERRVPPEAEFPPIRYLSEAERQSARRLKLRHLLLLLLRTALIVLIVMAAARPLVRSRGAVGGGAHEPTALALI